jgi:hypothetical protein
MAREQVREQREQRTQRRRTELPDHWGRITTRTLDFLKELGEINASLLGRLSRQQLDLLSASIEAGTRQVRLLTWPGGDYRSLLGRQASLIADYNDRFAEIARESTSIVSEATGRLTDWLQQGTAAFGENAEVAARGVERAVGRSAELVQEGVGRATRFTERVVARGVERERAGIAALDETEAAAGDGGEAILEVIPREDGWAVRVAGASRATSVHATKEEAVERARALAADRAPSRLVVHRKDGTVQDEVSYPT